MDAFLTVVFWIIQGAMAGLGVYVSLKPQPKHKHTLFIVMFAVCFVLGGTINTIQTIRNSHAQDTLKANIEDLQKGQQLSNTGITKIGGDLTKLQENTSKLEENTQQPPVFNVSTVAPQKAFVHGFGFQYGVYEIGRQIAVNEVYENTLDNVARKVAHWSTVKAVTMSPIGPNGEPMVPESVQDESYKAFIAEGRSKMETSTDALTKGQRFFLSAPGPILDEELDRSLKNGSKSLLLITEFHWKDDAGTHVSETCTWRQSNNIWHMCRHHNGQKF